MKGSKRLGLSKDGRQVLVKFVIQAVPTYPMVCFQLTVWTNVFSIITLLVGCG
jgi:hypothetical protein